MASLKNLEKWLIDTPLGRYQLANEMLFYHNIVPENYSLQLGLAKIKFLTANHSCNIYNVDFDIKSRFDSLAISSNSIDLIICPHIFEAIPNYFLLLQECYRILKPCGKIIISNFNKVSLLAPYLMLNNSFKDMQFIALDSLIKDLLSLNFNISAGSFLSYNPPINSQNVLAKLSWMEKAGNRWLPIFANSYILTALKSEVTLTPVGCYITEFESKYV